MTAVLDRIRRHARLEPRRLVLAEGADERVVRAADRLSRDRLAQVTLIGERDIVRATARRAEVAMLGVQTLDAGDPAEIERTLQALRAARGDRLALGDAERLARDPVFQAAARVREGLADCFVAGASRPTADILRAAIWLIGTTPGVTSVSSFFLMVVPPSAAASAERVFLFADGGVVPDPNPAQLAEIGCLTADNFARLTGEVPHTAFLSFSTRGSAEHPHVAKVREAVALARQRRPDRHFDGELQLDAAVDPAVARKKAPDSAVAGHANVLTFPDLDAGNIGYKLVQRLGGAAAYGPILQGLARQANDLSRGCSSEDVVEVSTIACVLSAGREAGLAAGARPRAGGSA
ncbi:MAG: phosphotransacetylase [Candidatus Eisenbacteria bacterium]|uniref:Phosphotransacetylase n=1 Tax=Eiseniibacteriota bacterium TaxID=2212470 RepID=A0A538U4C6_UNCEI|nr:MAG: phosphotransacetylase [Candidatus Eisenbacteria bacterium]